MGETIKAIANKIWDILVKFYNWVVEAIKKLLGRQAKMHQRISMIREIRQANEELSAEIAGEPEATIVETPDASDPSPRQKRAKELADAALKHQDAIKEYDVALSSLALDMLHESPLLGVMKIINLVIPRQLDTAKIKLRAIYDWLASPKGPVGVTDPSVYIGLPLPLPKALEATKAKLNLHEIPDTLAAYLKAVKDYIDLENNSKPLNPMEWKVAAKVVIDPRSGFDEPLMPMPGALFDSLKALSLAAKDIAEGDVFGDLPEEWMDAGRNLLITFMGDIEGINAYVNGTNIVLGTQADLVFWLWRCEVTEFEYHQVAAKVHGSPKVLKRLSDVQQKLRGKLHQYFPEIAQLYT
jgi:hypothetical protein